MSYRFRFELLGPKLPPTPNGAHGHWRKAAGIRKTWRKRVVLAVGIHRPAEPLRRAKVTFTRFSSVQPDDDNLAASFKSIRDGLKDAGVIIDDKSIYLESVYRWEKTKPKTGKVSVEVEEIDSAPKQSEQ